MPQLCSKIFSVIACALVRGGGEYRRNERAIDDSQKGRKLHDELNVYTMLLQTQVFIENI